MAKTTVYQLKITLQDSKPPIWRRVLVKATTTLFELHEIIQITMGWDNYHLHQFIIDNEYYATPHPDDWHTVLDERKYSLKKLDFVEKSKFVYEYDFGDGWGHTILVEKILPYETGKQYPRCIKGKRACPPEDVGGVWGYAEFLEAIKDPEHESYEMYVDWIGDDFDAEEFDLEEVNAILKEYF